MHHKQNNKESKTYVQGLRPFGNTLPRGLKGILKKNGYNYSEIISKWNLLVGKQIANFCYPKSIKMTKNNKNGILNLAVERGNEIDAEYAKKDIINKGTLDINSPFIFPKLASIFTFLLKNSVFAVQIPVSGSNDLEIKNFQQNTSNTCVKHKF